MRRGGGCGGFGGFGLLGVWMAKIVGNLWKMIGGHKAPHMFAVHYRVPKFGLIIERRCSLYPLSVQSQAGYVGFDYGGLQSTELHTVLSRPSGCVTWISC